MPTSGNPSHGQRVADRLTIILLMFKKVNMLTSGGYLIFMVELGSDKTNGIVWWRRRSYGAYCLWD